MRLITATTHGIGSILQHKKYVELLNWSTLPQHNQTINEYRSSSGLGHYFQWWIITWLRCFFPGFDRFIPGFDRFIPGFDRFIPASIPVTGTLPPPPTSKNISSKKMYFLNLISSFFISLIWNNTIKKYSAMPRMHIFLKNTVNTNPKLFRAQFNATGCRLWITACDRSLQSVVNVTQKTLF